jgi:hypothetical protein
VKQNTAFSGVNQGGDGKMTQSDHKSMSNEEFEKSEDKQFKAFVYLGKVGFSVLQKLGHAKGEMVNLGTSPNMKDKSSKANVIPNEIVISVKLESGEIEVYELIFDLDKEKYAKPGFAIIECYKLEGDAGSARGIKIDIPLPDAPAAYIAIMQSKAFRIICGVFATTMGMQIVRRIKDLYFGWNDEDEEVEVVKDTKKKKKN